MLTEFLRKNILLSDSQGIDHTLVICLFALTAIGFIMITSATLDHAYQTRGNSFYFIVKHSIYLIMGITLSFIVSRIKLSFYNDYSKILLSPASPSFDMFNNFEERGKAFKQAIDKYVN